MIICPSCRAEAPSETSACPRCGCSFAGVFIPGNLIAGRYEIVAPLGRGGMGVVYQAIDRALEEPVAIKVLRADFQDSPEIAQRFRAEIKLARKVSHRNVCRIYEYGQHANLHYISMELVSGTDLRTLLRNGPLSLAEAFEISIQSAQGLEAIHEVGVIHRDLKSSNIMRDHRGVVRLMDFGIAKQWMGGPTNMTMTGQIIGTPEYMSPEQARGEKIDFRSDLYSMGIVIFEVFTGHVPFHAPTPLATIFMHMHEPPPVVAASIPEPLRDVLLTCLAKDAAGRYNGAADLVEALRAARGATLGVPHAPIPSDDRTYVPGGQQAISLTDMPTPRSGIPAPHVSLANSQPAATAVAPLSPPSLAGPALATPPPSLPSLSTPVVRPPAIPSSPPPPPMSARAGYGGALAPGAEEMPTPVPMATHVPRVTPPPRRPQSVVPPPPPPPHIETSSDARRLTLILSAAALVLATVVALVAWKFMPTGKEATDGDKVGGLTGSGTVASPGTTSTSPGPTPTSTPTPTPTPTATPTPTPRPSPRSPSPPPVVEAGTLQLVVKPWAEVFVDDKHIGTTPLRKLSLPAGNHTLRLEHPAYQPLPRKFQVRPGETTTLELDLSQWGVPKSQ